MTTVNYTMPSSALNPEATQRMHLTIVSGRSGSGKTVALRVLEDLGYYCVDNLPIGMIPQLLKEQQQDSDQIAISIDVRNLPHNAEQLHNLLSDIRQCIKVTLLFLDTDREALIKRYSETRRLHPLSRHSLSLSQAIDTENKLLEPLHQEADLLVNTTGLSIHQLSDLVREKLQGKAETPLILVFQSFGFKHGSPSDADYMFDARFLPNPYWEPELRRYNGTEPPVQEFLSRQPLVSSYIWQIENLLRNWLPHLERSNRSYVTIAIGCTGGQHRSVYVAEQLAQRFSGKHQVQLHHTRIHHTHNKRQ